MAKPKITPLVRQPQRDRHTLIRIVQAFRPYRLQILLVLVAILVATFLGSASPLVIPVIFDTAIPQRDLHLLILCAGILLLIPLITGLISIGQSYLSSVIGQRVIRDLRNGLYSHLQAMSLNFFASTRAGEVQSRLFNDVSGVQSMVSDTFTRFVSNLSLVLGTCIAMVYISPLLSLFTLGILPVFVIITYRVGNAGRRIQKHNQQHMASLTTLMQETLSISGLLLTKVFGRQQWAQERFMKENQALADLGVQVQMITGWFMMVINTIFAVTPAIVYFAGGWQIITHPGQSGLTVGGIVAFTTLQTRLLPAIGQLLGIQVQVQGAFALFDRIFECLDLPVEIADAPNARHLVPEKMKGTVTFRNVSFTYRRSHAELADGPASEGRATDANPQGEYANAMTLKGLSFEIRAGQLVALVGPSGAGKTTITYLIPRIYEVDSGAVEIDGYNVKDLRQASLSGLIGMVTQETYLFHASIRENLLYARPEATEEELIAATKAAAIHERILEFADGYDTMVGERGYKLSGGEKQRLAIARVLLKNPRILILDEATSSLDTHSERLVQSALDTLLEKRTTLAIAHRLSTILAADVILVVDRGEIVERGTHPELLALEGVYSRLYYEQFAPEVEARAAG